MPVFSYKPLEDSRRTWGVVSVLQLISAAFTLLLTYLPLALLLRWTGGEGVGAGLVFTDFFVLIIGIVNGVLEIIRVRQKRVVVTSVLSWGAVVFYTVLCVILW